MRVWRKALRKTSSFLPETRQWAWSWWRWLRVLQWLDMTWVVFLILVLLPILCLLFMQVALIKIDKKWPFAFGIWPLGDEIMVVVL